MEVEKLSAILQNAIRNLDQPARSVRASELLAEVQDELVRRESTRADGFVPMLACVGYNVRWQGWTASERRKLLEWIIDAELPCVNNQAFMAEWGEPASLDRLRCLYRTVKRYLIRYGDGEGM